MFIKRVRIQNFRSVRSLDLELSDTTVFIGPNNAGKTAILDALRIALTRRWGQRGTGFTEYDVHLLDESSDPKASAPVSVEVEVQERVAGEWSADLQADLDDVIQTDPVSGRASILLRVSCGWDEDQGSYTPRWEFLNVARAPLAGRGARAINLNEFFQYLPVFYLSALRDADDEFSARSQFSGRLLHTVQIPAGLEQRARRIFDLLNARFLDADPLLRNIATAIAGISRVAANDSPGDTNLRIVPLRPWDLLSRAEVVFRSETAKPWLPLPRHGQGVQSLSVMFLFQAFVTHVLGQLFKPDSSPVLELEEPETHLHPQAARTLWRHVKDLPGQKLVTTHSPYFVQHVPFRDMRLVRMSVQGTVVASLPAEFTEIVPHVPALDAIVAGSAGRLRYDRATSELIVAGKLEEKLYRDLLMAYAAHPDRPAVHAVLRALRDRSDLFISDAELKQLETRDSVRFAAFLLTRWRSRRAFEG